jgi:hypothetical protein
MIGLQKSLVVRTFSEWLGCPYMFYSRFHPIFYRSKARDGPVVVDNIIIKEEIEQRTKRFKYKWANPSPRAKAGPWQKNHLYLKIEGHRGSVREGT